MVFSKDSRTGIIHKAEARKPLAQSIKEENKEQDLIGLKLERVRYMPPLLL